LDVSVRPEIELAGTVAEARRLRDRGFCPIECSFGSESVVDDLEMDHHGPYSHLEGVAVRAYRDHYGARREDPRFVTTGFPDEDATFAMAALAGVLPHPSLADRFPNAPADMRLNMRQNLLHVAEMINTVDLDPDRALELVDTMTGRLVLAFRQQAHPTSEDWFAWYEGVSRWRSLLSSQVDEVVNSAVASQQLRLEHVLGVRSKRVAEDVMVADLSTYGRNSAYYRAWLEHAPILIAFIGGPTGEGTCSFVCRSLESATRAFGPMGLRAVYPTLKPAGCGGRENIGGSSRMRSVTWDEALQYGKQIAAAVVS
ncbi:MAG: hypothetical protein KDD69_17780, partial [Bdellovibrionales bacterium]|nr:hypothetical protein [Bdellovibrionales bacterium]